MIRAVVFDAVGTLIQPEPGVAEVYANAAKEQGAHCDVAEVRTRFRQAFAADACDEHTNEAAERVRWRKIVVACLPEVPEPDRVFHSLWAHFGRPEAWRVFDDVFPALRGLKQRGVTLGVASNFDERLHSVLAGHDELQAMLDLVIASSTIGWRKPNAGFFTAIGERLGLPLADILYVGDDPNHDVAAARACGMNALQVDRTCRQAEAIASLTQLGEWLAGH
jgi:putative hydrolase of the HAD superfamily